MTITLLIAAVMIGLGLAAFARRAFVAIRSAIRRRRVGRELELIEHDAYRAHRRAK